jgi:hypothetical protein
MLADAATQSWAGLVRMRGVLRLPQPIVAVSGGVGGFEAVFVDLLAARPGAVWDHRDGGRLCAALDRDGHHAKSGRPPPLADPVPGQGP